MLWTDKRILAELPADMSVQNRCYPAIFSIIAVMKTMRGEYEAHIAELEAKLRTMSELEEQHLREIDRLVAEKKAQDNYIAGLEAMLTPEQLFDAAS